MQLFTAQPTTSICTIMPTISIKFIEFSACRNENYDAQRNQGTQDSSKGLLYGDPDEISVISELPSQQKRKVRPKSNRDSLASVHRQQNRRNSEREMRDMKQLPVSTDRHSSEPPEYWTTYSAPPSYKYAKYYPVVLPQNSK